MFTLGPLWQALTVTPHTMRPEDPTWGLRQPLTLNTFCLKTCNQLSNHRGACFPYQMHTLERLLNLGGTVSASGSSSFAY